MKKCFAAAIVLAAFVSIPAGVGAGSLAELDREVTVLVEKAVPGVVQIVCERGPFRAIQDRFPFDEFWGEGRRERYRSRSSGSGFIVDGDGHILTTVNVVEGAKSVRVVLADRSEHPAEIKGMDRSLNVAMLKIEAGKLTALPIGDSDSLRPGSPFIALGCPYGLPGSVICGIVSGRGRSGLGIADIEDLIQVNANINPGDSGGPLLNVRGEVVGILAGSMGDDGRGWGPEERAEAHGIAFAIPINMVREVIPRLRSGGEVEHGWLGVAVQELTPALQAEFGIADGRGVLIAGVITPGPADRAGLKEGDVIRMFDGKPVKTPQELVSLVSRKTAGEKAVLAVMRGGEELKVEVVVGKREEPAEGKGERIPPESLGLTVEKITPRMAERLNITDGSGILVTDVMPGSPAARAGIRRGDVIYEVNRKPVAGLGQWESQVAGMGPGGKLLVRTQRGFLVIKGE